MAKIKICGLRRPEDVKIINELKPDFAGFILSGGFKRSIDATLAKELISSVDSCVKKVGVFVDAPLEDIEFALEYGIDFVQLHGKEDIELCSKIKAPVIKMLKPDAFDRVAEYEPYVDYFLFDSGAGTGKAFDWSLMPNTNKPFFLAGGLSSENLLEAINQLNPYAVDMSSSVELDGFKNYDKIKEVIDIVRR